MDYNSIVESFYKNPLPITVPISEKKTKLASKPVDYDVGKVTTTVEELPKVEVATTAPIVQSAAVVPASFSWNSPKFRDIVLDAQMGAESAFKSDAVSPMGATGIAQFMPDTWAYMINKGYIEPEALPTEVAPSIKAQYKYMDEIYNKPWVKTAPNERERLRRTLAGYNAGPEAVRKALIAGDIAGKDWITMLRKPQETVPYVAKIMEQIDKNLNNANYQAKYDRSKL